MEGKGTQLPTIRMCGREWILVCTYGILGCAREGFFTDKVSLFFQAKGRRKSRLSVGSEKWWVLFFNIGHVRERSGKYIPRA